MSKRERDSGRQQQQPREFVRESFSTGHPVSLSLRPSYSYVGTRVDGARGSEGNAKASERASEREREREREKERERERETESE